MYKKIFVIGCGAPAMHCMELLAGHKQECTLLLTDSRLAPFVQRRLSRLNLPVELASRDNLADFFRDGVPALILSVGNMLIFPKEIVELPFLQILNYHNSLLPRHRGVNAEAWAIFEGDRTTGVTWHRVDCGIDTGRILAQQVLTIPEDITSAQLLRLQSNLALKLLDHKMDELLSGTCSLEPQPELPASYHKQSDRPNGGILSLAWDEEKIWNFLRAYDYGPGRNLGVPAVLLGNTWYGWKNYGRGKSLEKPGNRLGGYHKIAGTSIFLGGLYKMPEQAAYGSFQV